MTATVRYGVQIGAVGREGVSDAALYNEATVDAQLTQELGFDAAWLVEHHFSDYYPTPNPLVFLSHLAAACPGLGLGTAVMVLPWYDPVRFVEDLSMVATMAMATMYKDVCAIRDSTSARELATVACTSSIKIPVPTTQRQSCNPFT